MKKTRIVFAVCLIVILTGCVRQAPMLTGTPTPQFTPTPPPTPTPELILLPSDIDVDAMGKRIDTDSHFFQYLDLRDVRIYEYEGDTFLDAIFVNSYPEPLTGAFEIVFTEASGAELARAPLLTLQADSAFQPGETPVYAQIDTDMDIQLLPFEITVTQRIWPAARKAAME